MMISDFAIKRPIVTVTVMLALVVFGLFSLFRLDTDEFPDIVARAINRQLDFDPRNPADLERVSVTTPTGRVVPDIGAWRVRAGRLERLP